MKSQRLRQIKIIFSIYFFLCVAGCTETSGEIFLSKAKSAEASNNYQEAVDYYLRAFKTTDEAQIKLEAAKKLGYIYEVIQKDYKLAREYLKFFSVNTDDYKDAKEIEERLADINFNFLQDYGEALKSYYKLILIEESPAKKNSLQMKLAQSYMRLNDMDQALVEIEKISTATNDEKNFEVLNLKANILQAKNKWNESISLQIELLEKYPDKAKENEIFLALSVNYEQNQQLDKAIQVLEKYKESYPNKDFIDLRISSLKKRLKLAPLVKELKR